MRIDLIDGPRTEESERKSDKEWWSLKSAIALLSGFRQVGEEKARVAEAENLPAVAKPVADGAQPVEPAETDAKESPPATSDSEPFVAPEDDAATGLAVPREAFV